MKLKEVFEQLISDNTCINCGTIVDENLSISRGAIAPLGQYRDMWVFKKIDAVLKQSGLDISTPIKNIPEKILDNILFGENIDVAVESTKYPGTLWHTKFNGVSGFIKKTLSKGPT